MSNIQAIIFDNNVWNSKTARAWLLKHNHQPIKRVHKTKNYLRYRLQEPDNRQEYRLHDIGNGIKLVLGFG